MKILKWTDRLITLGLISLTYCWMVWLFVDQYIRQWLCIKFV